MGKGSLTLPPGGTQVSLENEWKAYLVNATLADVHTKSVELDSRLFPILSGRFPASEFEVKAEVRDDKPYLDVISGHKS